MGPDGQVPYSKEQIADPYFEPDEFNQCIPSYFKIYIQGVTGGTDQTSGGCSLC